MVVKREREREGGEAYGVVVANADVAVDVYAALAGREDGGDERGGVESRGDDVDALFGVTQGREPGGVLRGGDGVVGWRAVGGAVDEGHGVEGVGWKREIGGHEFAGRAFGRVGVAGKSFVDGVVEQPGDSLQVCLSWLGSQHGPAARDFACNVVVIVGVVCCVLGEQCGLRN